MTGVWGGLFECLLGSLEAEIGRNSWDYTAARLTLAASFWLPAPSRSGASGGALPGQENQAAAAFVGLRQGQPGQETLSEPESKT